MRSARVTERVGVQVRAARGHSTVAMDQFLDPAHAEASSSPAQKERAVALGTLVDELMTQREVRRECRARFRTDWHDALLAPLAEHAHFVVRELEVVQVESDELADAQTRAIQQLEQ